MYRHLKITRLRVVAPEAGYRKRTQCFYIQLIESELAGRRFCATHSNELVLMAGWAKAT
jgi:hypothetical protein